MLIRKLRELFTKRQTLECAAAVALPVLCLLPFLNKAYHIDDPVYLWVARQILAHPLDFYGFQAHWYTSWNFMYDINKNPPGISYFIALISRFLGEKEIFFHLAFLIPAAALSLGTYTLARRFCSVPLLAAASTVLTPVFLTSSSNLMSDVGMTAFFVWSAVAWLRSIEKPSLATGVASGFLIALAALTKYFALSLIPLLGLYALLRRPRQPWRCLPLLIPVLILCCYEMYTRHLYGKGMIMEAQAFATEFAHKESAWTRCMIAAGFLGGCLPSAAFVAVAARKWRTIAAALLLTLVLVSLIVLTGVAGNDGPLGSAQGIRWPFLTQFFLFALAGLLLFLLAAFDLASNRDAKALMLFSWIAGTLVFCAMINWTISARNLLPAAPAIGILLARVLERSGPVPDSSRVSPRWILPLFLSAAMAFAVTQADFRSANANRDAAAILTRQFKNGPARLYYMGHWGFQAYMDAGGAQPLDFDATRVVRGDVIVVPQNNYMTVELQQPFATLKHELALPVCSWLTTTESNAGGGFYGTDEKRMLPYAFGCIPNEAYHVYVVN